MASSTKTRGLTRSAGEAAGKRNAEPQPVRGHRRRRAAASTGFGAQLHSLKLGSKTGAEVIMNQYGGQVITDLAEGYHRYKSLVEGKEEVSATDFESVAAVRESFDKLIGDAEYNIVRGDEGRYHFLIYEMCEYDWGWYVVPVKPIVLHLAESNKDLHDLFVQFIKCFTTAVGIECWWDYTIEQAQDWLQENIDQMVSEGEDIKEFDAHMNCLADYKAGKAAEYENLIKHALKFEPQEFKMNLESCGIEHALIDWMMKGCDLASEGCTLRGFEYEPEQRDEDYGERKLELEYTVTFLWDIADHVTAQQEDWMQMEANNGGVHEPYCTLMITPETDKLFQKSDWPIRLQHFIDEICDYLKTIEDNEKRN